MVTAKHSLRLVAALSAAATITWGCSKSGGGGGGSAETPVEQVINTVTQPSSGSTTNTNTNTGGTTTTKSSLVTIAGSLALAAQSGSGSSLRLAGDDTVYKMKFVTTSITDQKACVADVSADDGSYSVDCDGFKNKTIAGFVLKGTAADPENFEVAAVIAKIAKVSEAAAGVGVDISFDSTTGAAAVEGEVTQEEVSDTGEKVAIDTTALDAQVDVPEGLTGDLITDGDYQFNYCDSYDQDKQRKLRKGDFSFLPAEDQRSNQCQHRESYYVDFTAAISDAGAGNKLPRLELWRSAEDATACANGYHLSDGTNTVTGTPTYGALLEKIMEYEWAPAAAIARYNLMKTGGGGVDPEVEMMMEAFGVDDADALATALVNMLKAAYQKATVKVGKGGKEYCDGVKYVTPSPEMTADLNGPGDQGPPREWCMLYKKDAAAAEKVFLADIKMNVVGQGREQLEASRGMVEEFLRSVSESRHNVNPDKRFDDLQKAIVGYNKVKDSGTTEAIDASLKAVAKAWAAISWDQQFKSKLLSAVKKFSTVDNINLGGTGKSYIQSELANVTKYENMIDLVAGLGWDYWGAPVDQIKEFATAWKARETSGTELYNDIEAAITKMNDADQNTQNQGKQEALMALDAYQRARQVFDAACQASGWEIDFGPAFTNDSAKTAFNTFFGALQFPTPGSQNWQVTVKDSAGQARTVVAAFINGVAPYLAACDKMKMYQSLPQVNQSTKWTPEGQVALSDEERNQNALQVVSNLSWQVSSAKVKLILFSLNVADPSGDNNALINSDGTQNESYSQAEAQEDLDALATKVKELINASQNYSWLCWNLSEFGISVSDVTACQNQGGGGHSSNLNVYGKLFGLQNRISDMVARESFRTDPTYLAKKRDIEASSQCAPSANVNFETVADDQGNPTFEVKYYGPVKRLMAGDVNFVLQARSGAASQEFFMDGSRLETHKQFGGSSCYSGEVQQLDYLALENSEITQGVMARGWINTCGQESGGGDSGGAKLAESSGGDDSSGSDSSSGSSDNIWRAYFDATKN